MVFLVEVLCTFKPLIVQFNEVAASETILVILLLLNSRNVRTGTILVTFVVIPFKECEDRDNTGYFSCYSV